MVLRILLFEIQQDLLNGPKLQSSQKIHLKMSNYLCLTCFCFPFLLQKFLLTHWFFSVHLHMSVGNLHMDLEENKIPEIFNLVLTSICSRNCVRSVCLFYGQFIEEKSVHQNLQIRKLGCKKNDMHAAIIVIIILL